jgi:ATP-dependent RNA helicase RhlB
VAFLLGCCQHLATTPEPADRKITDTRALILAPTRELAIQIYEDALVLAKHTGLSIGLIYGGTGYDEQKRMLSQGSDILIGTPGRLIDFYKQKLFSLDHTEVVVLDEADRMFDLGFIKDIRFLLRRMPDAVNRLNMLFSATLSYRVMELAYEHMNNPEEIKIDADVRVAHKIIEYSYFPSVDEKPALLVNLLRRNEPDRVLVFVNTRHAVDQVARSLEGNSIKNAALSGDVPQKKREKLLKGFKDGKYQVLVATDVAARGLHIPEVNQVFNYDLPQDAEDYVHRIGRTARAGKSGEAISFICEKYAYSIMEIESFIGHSIVKKEIEAELLHPVEQAVGKSAKDQRKGEKSHGKSARDKHRVSKKFPGGSEFEGNDKVQSQPERGRTSPVGKSSEKPERKSVSDNTAGPAIRPVPNQFSKRFGEIPVVG